MKLITLKPLTPFFFGYNDTFGKKGGNYYVKSALFPQQTAILGMIRKEILLQAGFLTRKLRDEWVDINNSNEAKKYVGSGKFKNFDDEIDLGKIKSISPIFLKKDNDFYFLMPDIKKIEKIDNEYLIDFDYKDFKFIIKHHLKDEYKEIENVFKSVEVSGNSKNDEVDSFYKKLSYTLEEFEFAFFADIDFELKDSIVKLGADSSMFKMSVTETKMSFDDIEFKKYFECNEKVSLVIGDSYINDLKADFGITKKTIFKTIKQTKKFTKTKKIELYEKGTIFINLQNDLKQFPKNIGFNYIKELK